MSANWTSPLWSVALFVVYVATSCLGLYLIKIADTWKTTSFVGGFALYGLGALIWIAILRMAPLSYAFPIAAGLMLIGTVMTGILFLGETVSLQHIAGTFLILVGIVIIAGNR